MTRTRVKAVFVDIHGCKNLSDASLALSVDKCQQLPSGCKVDVVRSNFAAIEQLAVSTYMVVFLSCTSDVNAYVASSLIRNVFPDMKIVLLKNSLEDIQCDVDAELSVPFSSKTFVDVLTAMLFDNPVGKRYCLGDSDRDAGKRYRTFELDMTQDDKQSNEDRLANDWLGVQAFEASNCSSLESTDFSMGSSNFFNSSNFSHSDLSN